MKITTPAGYIVEGSVEELQGLVRDLIGDLKVESSQVEITSGNEGSTRIRDIAKLIQKVIERAPELPAAQKDLYRVLFLADDKGLAYRTLAARMGRTDKQLNGVLGALGRRINNTPGVEDNPGVGLLLSFREKAPPENNWGWAMKQELRSVLEEQKYSWLKSE
jgi:hypothetical protein